LFKFHVVECSTQDSDARRGCSGSVSSQSSNIKKDDVTNELKNKFKLAEGQLRTGNNNPLVKKELKDILKKLTLYTIVALKNSKEYLKQF
jgi:hypothetical protein